MTPLSTEEFRRRGITVRGFVNGNMVFAEKVPLDFVDDIAQKHMALIENYLKSGDDVFLIEIIFPDGHHVRLGTDDCLMVAPVKLPL